MTSPLKTCLAGLLAISSISFAQAQTNSSTPVIGYYKQTFPDAGLYPFVPGFVNRSLFQGQATTASVVGTTLTIDQTSAGWAPGQFTLTPHYLEIISDGNANHAGLILDIASNGAAQLTAVVPSGFVVGVNTQYVIRKHLTLGSVLGAGSGVNEVDGDGAILIDPSGNPVNATYTGAGVWVSTENPSTILTDTVLYPGEGLIFFPAGGPRTLTIGGGDASYVKSGPTQFSLPAGVVALVGLINPLVPADSSDPIYTTSGRNSLAEMGVVATLSELDADLGQIFSSDGLLSVIPVIKSGADAVNPEDNTIQNSTKITNGQAILMLSGADKAISLPQRH